MELTTRPGGPPRATFVGLTTVDIVFGFDGYPDENTKNTARQYAVAAGGPASNAAVAFSFLGGEARLISALGTSSIAAIARTDLVRHGVRHFDMAGDREAEPALSTIAIAERNGSRTIFTSPAIDDELAAPFPQEQVWDSLDRSDVLLLDGHQNALATQMAQRAKENGVPVVLDGDLYGPHANRLLPLVDIVIFGKTFAIPGYSCTREMFRYFESFGIQHAIATNGEKPIEFSSSGVFGDLEIEKVSAVDTLAAGDFFHGAFCYSYSTGRDIRRALKFAARVAASSVTSFGTRGWMELHDPSSFT